MHGLRTSLSDPWSLLDLIGGARRLGLDVTTEAYPYTAGSTSLHSSIFDEGWQGRLGIDYGDLQWEATGERLTRETFERYRRERGTVILHFMKEEWIETALGNNWVIVASDGMPYAPKAHPRTAGTYSRVLGRYVRERGTLDLTTALLKMTLLPVRASLWCSTSGPRNAASVEAQTSSGMFVTMDKRLPNREILRERSVRERLL